MSNIVAIDNFTVTSQEFIVPGGALISSVTPSAVLTITPNQGYEIDASNFSVLSSSPLVNVPGSFFTQDGNAVILTVLFVTNATMPSSNLDIKICMRGASEELGVTITGAINYDLANATSQPNPTTYSNSGAVESVEEILSQQIQADAGYYFQGTPTISLNTGILENYNLFTSNNVLTNNRLTAIRVTADYTYPNANKSGDIIDIYAHAVLIPVIPQIITSFSVNSSSFSYVAINRTFSIFGGQSANYEVTINNGATFASSGTSTLTGVMGVSAFNDTIVFPTVTADTTHTLIFSPTGSDLDPSAPSTYWTVPFVRSQVANIELAGNVNTSDTDFTITNDGPTAWNPNSTNIQNSAIEFIISVPSTYTIDWITTTDIPTSQFATQVTDGDFSLVRASKSINNSNELVLEVTATTVDTGAANFSYTLLNNIETFITKTQAPLSNPAGASTTSSTNACASPPTAYLFFFAGNIIVEGATVYTNFGLTNIFVGDSGWYRVDSVDATRAMQINSLGKIIGSMALCP